MRNDTETSAENTETDATELAPTVNWTYTALGYVFVLAMGAVAVWVTPSPDAESTQKLLANAATSFTPFSGGSGRVVLAQPAQAPDVTPAPHPAPLAVAAYD
jgi:hypothetical protein